MLVGACLFVLATSCGRVGYNSVSQKEENAGLIDAAVSLDGSEIVDAGASPDAEAVDAGMSARELCCTTWCQDDNRFGPGATVASEGYIATEGECSSSTGCTCAVSAWIASTWTVVTGNVCDAHNFWENSEVDCDGSQCPVVSIRGRLDALTDECVCVGKSNVPVLEEDVWSSTCVENEGSQPFLSACPGSS